MKVTFRTNLGSRDAALLHLDHEKCHEGDSLTVSEEVAKWLADRGIVEPLPEKIVAVAKPVELKAPAKEEKRKVKSDE